MLLRTRTPFIALLTILLLLSIAPLRADDDIPTVPWPTEGWTVSTPEEQGIDSAVLVKMHSS